MSNPTASEAATPPDQKAFGDVAPAIPGEGGDVKAFINWWQTQILSSRKWHSPAFQRMQEDSDLVRTGSTWAKTDTEKYVVNLAQSEVAASVATLYAKNPTFTVTRKPRLDFAIWDENPQTLQEAQLALEQATVAGMPAPDVMALLEDVNQGKMKRMKIERIARTLELVFRQQIEQQQPVFKSEMKQLIRRVETHGAGFIKLDFQRLDSVNPEVSARISDLATRLAHIEGLMKETAGGGASADYARQAEELRISMKTLQEQSAVITTEGLLVHFPRTPSLIIDKACSQLRGFVGARFIAEEFHLSKCKIFEIYKVDVGSKATAYDRARVEGVDAWQINAKKDKTEADYDDLYRVWEVYHPETGSTFTICEGFDEYLRAPTPPKLLLEGFYPYHTLMFNEIEDETCIYPPSTVRLIRHQVAEFNRSKEALRQHRIASKPHYGNADGTLVENDMTSLESAPAHSIIKLQGLQPGQKVEELLQQIPKHPIDANVYETDSIRGDIQMITRRSAARTGAASNATATADSIAEDGRQAEDKSKSDELDDFMTLMARDAGATLLLQMSPDTAREIAGPGAAWPEADPHIILSDIELSIQAGSSGAPNQAVEVAKFQRLFPLLVQTPGIKPQWLAKMAVKLADANIDLTDAYLDGMPSIQAINAAAVKAASMMQTQTGNPKTNPSDQGQEGDNKIQRPPGADNQMTVSQGMNDIPALPPGQNNILQ
jgi:hypothetical protein